MTILNIVLATLALPVVLAILFGLLVLRGMFTPTRGKRIGVYPRPTVALLVMDIQESPGANRQHLPSGRLTPLESMIAATNRVIERFEKAGMEVAYVRQVFGSDFVARLHGGRILSGRLEPQIDRRVKVINANDFKKNRTDAFSNRELERLLIARQVDEVFLVGLDAAFCVYYTALGALNRGYKVTVIQDAVLSRQDMVKVLERFRRKGIRVLTSRELDEITSLSSGSEL